MFFIKNLPIPLVDSEKGITFALSFKEDAQMAESVDALVSNTSGATHPGSTPGLGTMNTSKLEDLEVFLFYPTRFAALSSLSPPPKFYLQVSQNKLFWLKLP